MEIEKTALEGVFILTPRRFGDDRGYFSETWNRKQLEQLGIRADFVQDNHSLSVAAGTIRGLHYQSPPHAQTKLVRAVRGRILDVAVDARRGSPAYGRWISAGLSAANGRQLLVPAGFLHGFATLEPDCEVAYKVTDYYAADCDGSVLWNDSTLGIDWQLGDLVPVLSAKDAAAPSFGTFQTPFSHGPAQ